MENVGWALVCFASYLGVGVLMGRRSRDPLLTIGWLLIGAAFAPRIAWDPTPAWANNLGVLLSVAALAIFTWGVVRRRKARPGTYSEGDEAPADHVDR